MSKDLLLGVDIGTYESKGVLTTKEGKVIASMAVGHELSIPKAGYAEHDADAVWWQDFVKICHGLIQQSESNPVDIAGIGISAIAPCVLPLDQYGVPLRPAILYGIDTRAKKEILELEQILGRQNIFETSGLHLSSQAAGPKIAWIRANEPDIWKKTSLILTGSSYLVYKLTGQPVIDLYTATAYAPMLDINKREWSRENSLPVLPIHKLPQLAWTVEIAGRVKKQAAIETGLAEGTPVIAGTADAAAEAISAGLSEFGDLMIMYGSSIFFIQKTANLVRTERMWSAVFMEDSTYALAAGMSTAGSLTRWFRDQFAQDSLELEQTTGRNAYAILAEQAEASPPGARGLVVLPYFSGERTPIHDPDACGLMIGLNLTHKRQDVYRAILEGVGYGIRHNIEVMREEGVRPTRFLAIGGGTKNHPWLKMISDIVDIEQWVPEQQFGACYGDAFLAGVGVGLFPNTSSIHEWVKPGKLILPNLENHARYDPYYQIYREVYEQTASSMHKLVRLR